jgi:hypothetical protein
MAAVKAKRFRFAWPWRRASTVLLGAVLCMVAARAAQSGPTETQIKAAFLLNFTAFVEWPESAFQDARSPIIVGIAGNDPFGPFLDELLAGETVAGRPLTLRRIKPGEDPAGCHLLFISDSERPNWASLMARLRGQPCVTVGNGPDFIRAGGIIEFAQDRGRVRFRISQAAARASGVVLSSKLLRLAQP